MAKESQTGNPNCTEATIYTEQIRLPKLQAATFSAACFFSLQRYRRRKRKREHERNQRATFRVAEEGCESDGHLSDAQFFLKSGLIVSKKISR